MKKIALILSLFVTACTPTQLITTNSCNPAPVLMQKDAETLPQIDLEVMTEQQILELLINDDAELIQTRREKNALIDHVTTYCQEGKNAKK